MYWNFIPELSVADPASVTITTLNPPFLGALQHAKNDKALPIGYSAVVVRELLEFMKGQYWTDTKIWDGSSAIVSASDVLIQKYSIDNHVSLDVAKAWFLNFFANSTTASPTEPQLNLFSLSLAIGKVPASDTPISAESAQKLFNSSNSLSFAYPASSFFDNAFSHWINAVTNTSRRVLLQDSFGLTDSQMSSVLAWLQSNSVMNGIILNYEQNKYGFASTEGMLTRAFCQGRFGNGVEIATLYPSLYSNGPVSYFGWQTWHGSKIANLTDSQCAKMFLSQNGKDLTSALILGDAIPEFLASWYDGNVSIVKSKWDVDNKDVAYAIAQYYVPMPIINPNPISELYGAPAVAYWKTHGSGLFATRSVAEWLWNYTDPLAIRLMPDAPPMSFRHNLSTPAFAKAHTRPWTINTGMKDISKLQNTIVWDGFAEVPFYGAPLKVKGVTEDGQYAPFLKCDKNIRLDTWIDDYAKNIPLVCIDDKSHLRDLKTFTYTPDNTTWLVNPSLENFIPGFSNLSAKYNDSPVFLSNPHFFGSPPYYPSRIIGDASVSHWERDQTIVLIEPYTGKVAKFRKGLQANLFISKNVTWFIGSEYANMYTDVMFPVMIGYVYTEATPTLLQIITGSVYVALKAFVGIFWTLVGLTILSALLTIVFAIVYRRRLSKFERKAELHPLIQ